MPLAPFSSEGSGRQAASTSVTLLGRYSEPTFTYTPARPTATAVQVLPPTRVPTATATQAPTEAPARRVEPTVEPKLPAAAALDDFEICSPVAEILLADLPRLISDGYHPPVNTRSDERHVGIDIAFYNWKGYRQIAGAPVQSVLPGRAAVVETGTFPLGNVVIVETPAQQIPVEIRSRLGIGEDQSLYLLYAHMQDESLRVRPGAAVTACQTLGQVGKSGNAGAAHLHLETRIGTPDLSLTGFAAYTEAATEAERKNYRRWTTSGEFRHFDPLRLLLYEIGYPTPAP